MICTEIQNAQISDRYAIAYLDQCAKAEAGRVQCSSNFIDPVFESSWEERFDARTSSRGHRQIIVAKSCGIVIGYANFSYSNTQHYFIESIGVANNYRNLGIGQALLQTIVDEVLPPQMRVTVDVPEYFSDSVAFFKRAGFEPADRRARTSTRNTTRLVLDLSSR